MTSQVSDTLLPRGRQRALFQASFAPKALKPGGLGLRLRSVTHLPWQHQLLVGRLIINMFRLVTETRNKIGGTQVLTARSLSTSLLSFSAHDTACIPKENVGILLGNPVLRRDPLLLSGTVKLPRADKQGNIPWWVSPPIFLTVCCTFLFAFEPTALDHETEFLQCAPRL